MTFPATPLDMTVELWISDAWEDITDLVMSRDGMAEKITVTRGRSGEGAQTDRSRGQLTVNNRSGNLSPRNPTGTWYGLIGRNTPIRVKVTPASDGYIELTDNLATPSTPDVAAFGITGDLDVRVDLARVDWDSEVILAGQYGGAGGRAWHLRINADKTLVFGWSADGSAELSATSTAAVSVADGERIAVRATIDVVNGANKTVTFYTAPTIDGSYTQLGSAVTTAGNTSIFNSSLPLEVGELGGTPYFGPTGQVYGFELRNGIGGTLVADLDLGNVDPTSATLTDSLGNLWTLGDDAKAVNPAVRFVGEISEWPPRWDVSGTDVYTPLEASGILRRLGQGTPPLHSTLYRGYAGLANPPKAYWPCEDSDDATVIASAVPGGSPMTLKGSGRPGFGQHADFKCSAPLPTMGESEWTGRIAEYTATGIIRVWWLMHVPAAGTLAGEVLIHIVTTGTAQRWRLYYGTGGTLELRAYDVNDTQILTTGAVAFNVNGRLLRVALELTEDGADVDYRLAVLEVGASVGNITTGTLTTDTVGRATVIQVNGGADIDDVVMGHISVHDDDGSIFDLFEELNAYTGEAAGRRIERLCVEEDVTFRPVGHLSGGSLDDSTPMGPQLPGKLIDLLREAETADGGILFEPRDLLGLAYRTRESMYHQDPALTLDYANNDLSGIEPTDDDQHVRNDLTVTRIGGSSVRAVKEDGPLSIEAPPDGVGRYDEEIQLSIETDDLLPDAAGWRLHLGTVDEARYPVLGVDLARANFIGANLAKTSAVEDLDLGDRLVVENPPAWIPPEDISQLVQGTVEVLVNKTHTIDINCSPETPWGQAAFYDDADARYTSDGSTLAEALDTTETGVDVATPSGPLWSAADQPFDIFVGGERMTVTAVSGASSPQTFTVTRSVNGVVKTHASGAEVELFHPSVYVP